MTTLSAVCRSHERILVKMSSVDEHIALEEGQFDDAPEVKVVASHSNGDVLVPNPRSGHTYIDEDNLLEWSSNDSEEEEPDEFDAEEDLMEVAAFHGLRAEDEDWEIAERGSVSIIHKRG